MKIDPICLVGSMGSGKTTAAHALAKLLRCNAKDLDAAVEAQEGMPVSETIRQKGMPYFREVEARILKQLLMEHDLVIATGGGAFVEKQNQQLMLDSSLVVWPYVPLAICRERLSKAGEIAKRPLMSETQKEIAKRFNDRLPAYRRAHVIVNGIGTPAEVARSILRNRATFL